MQYPSRPRFALKQEFALALLPTLVVLIMLAGVDAFTRQRLLFASLASSAFLIYLDPGHPANSVRTVILAQGSAAVIGFAAVWLIGPGLWAAGSGMILTIILMIFLNAMHPPAVSTALVFSFRASPASTLSIFALSLLMIVILVLLQQASLWTIKRYGSTGKS